MNSTEVVTMVARMVSGVKVRYAVVGLGWIAQAGFLPGVEHTGNSEVVALVSGHKEKLAKIGEMYGIDKQFTYEEYEELLISGEIDAVYIALPNWEHVEFAVKALNAGIDVLLEKPMAISVTECEQILAAAEKSKAKLMVAYRLHHEQGTLTAMERVRSGEIGTARLFNSTFSQLVAGSNHRALNGFWAGPVPDMGTYPINQVRNIFGAEPIEVFAMGVCTDPEKFNFEDTVAVTLKFDKARVASFTLCYNGGDVDDCRVVGAKGDLFSQPAYQVGSAIEHVMTVDKKETTESFKATDHFGGELKYFSDCILHDRMPEADGEEGMLDVRVIEAIERSLRTGQVQRLEPYHRRKRPVGGQVQELSTVPEPELVGAKKPSDI
jgi:predicted dehydrogenase